MGTGMEWNTQYKRYDGITTEIDDANKIEVDFKDLAVS